MKRLLAVGLGSALLTRAVCGQACGCGVPGLDAALTDERESWGVRLAESARLASGHFNARGEYRRLTAAEAERRHELSVLVAYRPLPRLELSTAFSYLHDSVREGGVSSSLKGFGDLTTRARFEALDETAPFADEIPLPALAVTAALRAPTAATSDATSLGLGAWEAALGLSLERSATARLRFGMSTEVALRGPNSSLGIARRLGPRVSSQASAWYWPAPQVALSLSSGLLWEDATTVASVRMSGTGSRQWHMGLGAVYRPRGSRLRPAVAARYVPPIAPFGVNALAATTVEISLAYTR